MGDILKANELNNIAKNSILFKKNSKVNFIGMIVKGRITIDYGSVKCKAVTGEIIGLPDVFANKYLCNYLVEEDTIFYAFPASDVTSLENFLKGNSDYRGIFVGSIEREMMQFLEDRDSLFDFSLQLHSFLKEHYANLEKEGSNEEIPKDFLEKDPKEIFQLKSDEHKIAYFIDSCKVPLDAKKRYFYNSEIMALYHAEDIASVIHDILESSQKIIQYIKEAYSLLTEERTGLFDQEIRFAREVKKNGTLAMELFIRIKDTKEEICKICDQIESRTGEELNLNRSYLDKKLSSVLGSALESSKETEEESQMSEEEMKKSLEHSLDQILTFAKVEEQQREEITKIINAFVNVRDRLSTDDDVRKLKKQITSIYFSLYKSCLFPWMDRAKTPLAVKLFLNYGYMDERLLDESQIIYLCKMLDEKDDDLPCKIYRMPEWLKEIYEGRKETSRNSFENDYRDTLREEKRTGKITEKQEREYLEDNRRKVAFEIDNMFASNNKIVNGKLSTYVPILYKDQFYGDIERLYLTKKQLCDTILELEKKDFTVFYREVLYTNPELKIEKENVMKHVYPDVILAPVYGTTSSMWQEITGKKRDTPARFIFSVFSENEVEKSVTKAFGRYHWEYCRCEQGAAWNNIQYRSLTSEYMDYIQYYRKNHELTEEKRDKIKIQIQKARNNSREVFLSDYEVWIYSESKAAMKLNKVSRQILATYCPFQKEIRERLETNAAFTEAMMQQKKNFGEKAREWDMRIRRRENNNLVVPEEFLRTYNYYAKM